MPDAARTLPEIDDALRPGTRLEEFEIRRQLGAGGFGIAHLAFDLALEREVAIKEYMPASMAGRTQALHVSLRSRSDAEVFALGLRSFVNEARLLARFDHPSLIKVHRFWEANNTAYMAMPVMRGETLQAIRRASARAPDEAWLRALLTPLLGALEQLHDEGVYHRDIAPDNIHLEAAQRPVLLDFGAARRVISGKTQTLTAILKPAYAPIEQYGETDEVKQGPWTDVYALGATLHYMLLGRPPAPATARMLDNEATALTQQALPGCSAGLLGLIEWMLAPRPVDRPQTVAQLRAVLEGRAPLPRRAAGAPPSAPRASATAQMVTVPLAEDAPADIALEFSALAPAPSEAGAEALRADAGHRLPPPPSRARRTPLVLGGAALAAALGYAAWMHLGATVVVGAASAAASAPVAAVAAEAPVSAAAREAPAPPASTAAPPADEAVSSGSAAEAPAGAPPLQSAAAAAPAAAVAPAAVPAPAPPAGRAPVKPADEPPGATPQQRCAGRTPLSTDLCMERECQRPRFRFHPECSARRAQTGARDAPATPGR